MNVIHRRTYTLVLDVWEATQDEAEKEIDYLIQTVNSRLGHCGNVKLIVASEERL